MGELSLCCVAPHPPIMVPEIGRDDTVHVRDSAAAMEELADEIERIGPDAMIVMSPHTPVHADSFAVKTAPRLHGSFGMFGAPGVTLESEPDMHLIDILLETAARRGLPLHKTGAGPLSDGGDLDHGILVPLYFLLRKRLPLVCLSVSLLGYRDHFKLGTAIREAVASSGRRAVFVGSGDMSHRLKPGAPAGYSPRGEEFDQLVADVVNGADWGGLFRLDPLLVDEAGECGLRSIFTLAGAVDGYGVDSEVLSYEGPFGVGYLVARVKPLEPDPGRVLEV